MRLAALHGYNASRSGHQGEEFVQPGELGLIVVFDTDVFIFPRPAHEHRIFLILKIEFYAKSRAQQNGEHSGKEPECRAREKGSYFWWHFKTL